MSHAQDNHLAQKSYWDGEGGDKWLRRSDDVDIMVAPAQDAAIALADIRPGQRVLDIGCGCGGSTMALAGRVGPSGHVLALDISRAMIAHARERARNLPQVACHDFDVSTHPFAPESFDLMFSRFGVMFFGDPAAAFAHLRGALKPDGRLVFVCWRPIEENAWMRAPLRAVCKHVPRPPRPAPDDPGPYSFADPERVTRILTQAGFDAPRFHKFDFDIDLALGRGLAAAVENAASAGAASAALANQPDHQRAAALAELRRELAPVEVDGRVPLPAAVWIVIAQGVTT